MSFGTIWRTVRHLRPVQVTGRVRFRLARPRPDLRPSPPRRQPTRKWVTPAAREPSLIAPGRFRFLNVERNLDECGWDRPDVERLWRYNLHYFDALNARGSTARVQELRSLVERWVTENPPAAGTGWEPYPVSLRMVNWIKWFTGGVSPTDEWLQSLAVQARWLEKRLEWHLLGNHLFSNAKALIFAGLFFEGPEADRWLHRGTRIVREQLREQVLEDGGHFERSPMYHALFLEDLLDLQNLLGAYGQTIAELHECSARMLYWLRCMCFGDGTLGSFNDSASGVAPSLSELERYAIEIGVRAPQAPLEGVTHLEASGYLRAGWGRALALLDLAPVGPDYLPGHAHADTLSFELALGETRLVVNGGTSCYGKSERRMRERSTAAHSTVEIAARNSSEVWSSFRVGRRARPHSIVIKEGEVCGSHDGYRHLSGSPQHRRCWRFEPGALVVEDVVSPAAPAVARFLLGPGLRVEILANGDWGVTHDDKQIATVHVVRGHAKSESATHAPRFGVVVNVDCLAVELSDGQAVTRWKWADDAHSLSH
jgi:hypothetical protein